MRQIPFLPLLKGIEQAQIDELARGWHAKGYTKDAAIYGPMSAAPALGFLTEGTALVYKAGTEEHPVLMSRLIPGSMFGMASLFSKDAPFPTVIRAETPCAVTLWPKASVEAAIIAEPRLAANYIALLSERIHFLNRRIDALTGDDLPARLYRVLEQLGIESGAGAIFTLPYSMTQLAEHLGIGRASLYRALDALEHDGHIRRDGKHITLLAPTKEETR